MRIRYIFPLLALLALTTTSVIRADDNEGPTYTDPEKAGPDYAVQGEYVGMLGAENDLHPWGVQIIALGHDTFALVGYKGGLPGDGWSRGDESNRIEGKRQGQQVRFEVEKDGKVEIVAHDGKLDVSHNGQSVGSLEKVERKSPTLGAKPPEGAIVLFDGSSADNFEGGQLTEDHFLAAGCETKDKFQDFTLHIEFRTPFKPEAREQGRGNSGVYAQNRYEIQVLDSFGLEGKDNECGAIYSKFEPKVNMCFPPLTWQTYDIDFTAARYSGEGDDAKKTTNARITVKHNGVIVHDNLELAQGSPGKNPEGPTPDGIYLQGHGNPVVYRNIWIVKK